MRDLNPVISMMTLNVNEPTDKNCLELGADIISRTFKKMKAMMLLSLRTHFMYTYGKHHSNWDVSESERKHY